jgi:signal peptidase II
MSRNAWIVFVIVGAIVLIDQVTKEVIVRTFALHESRSVISCCFDLTHVRNTGAAFSLLADAPIWFRQPFFLATTGVAVVALLVFLRRTEGTDALVITAIAAILGGAVGNLIDRLRYGEVIDFLLVHWRYTYLWPAFNVADSCITLGVIGLLWSSLREQPSKR